MIRIGRGTRIAAAAVVALLSFGCGADDPVASPETLGFRAGSGFFDGERFDATEEWLGRDILYTVQFTGRQDPQDMNGSAFGLLADENADLPDYVDRLSLSITVPLAFGQANARDREGRDAIAERLSEVATGELDDAYVRLGARLVEAGYGDAIIRLGHEFSGSWAPWSSRTNEQQFIAAWRHVHGVLRSVSPDFQFDWTTTRSGWLEWGSAAYPGDDYVDIVGMDVYWRTQVLGTTWDSNTFEREFLRPMRDHRDFAGSRGKELSYPEWGLSGSDSPGFIEAMHDWFARFEVRGPGGLRYHSYFDSGEEFELAQYPAAARRYRELFGP